MVKIYKYKNYLETTEYKPDQEWSQVDNNLTSISSILISINNLEKNECLVIRKYELSEEKKFLDETLKRAERYKKKEKIYPDSIEELIAWEEINNFF